MNPPNSFLRSGLWIAICVLATTPVSANETNFIVAGYLPDYRVAQMDADQIRGITDLIFFGVKPPTDGSVARLEVDSNVLAKLQQIKQATDCRLLLCVGGWGRSEGFAETAMNDATRKRFIADLNSFCRLHRFDGVDYDWEHPKNDEELKGYARLLSDTKEIFTPWGGLVTVAQAAWQDLGREAYAAVDRVHLMSYDHEFPHATLAKSVADVQRITDWGCPAEKIAWGIPFYGRNANREAIAYGEMTEQDVVDPQCDLIDGFAFNGRETIIKKVNIAKTRKLAGIMIWELGQDASNPERSLLATIKRATNDTNRER